jgi:hypothetical protein
MDSTEPQDLAGDLLVGADAVRLPGAPRHARDDGSLLPEADRLLADRQHRRWRRENNRFEAPSHPPRRKDHARQHRCLRRWARTSAASSQQLADDVVAVPGVEAARTAKRRLMMFRNRSFSRTTSRRRQSARGHFRNGQRAAVVRAVTAARLYLSGAEPTLASAAVACGSGVVYVRAAIAVLRREQPALLADVLTGRTSLLRAAKPRKPETLAEHFARAPREEWREAARLIGPGRIWDEMLVPVIA